jgi:hypothetical protein
MQYKSCSHVGHLVMTFLTGGLWLLVWVWCAVSVSRHNKQVDAAKSNEQLELLRRIADGQEATALLKKIQANS